MGSIAKLLNLFPDDQYDSLKHIIFPLNLGRYHWVMIKIDLCSKMLCLLTFSKPLEDMQTQGCTKCGLPSFLVCGMEIGKGNYHIMALLTWMIPTFLQTIMPSWRIIHPMIETFLLPSFTKQPPPRSLKRIHSTVVYSYCIVCCAQHLKLNHTKILMVSSAWYFVQAWPHWCQSFNIL